MGVALVCAGFANGAPCPWVGQYLRWYYPQLPEWTVLAEWTDDVKAAKIYPTPERALSEWQSVRLRTGVLRADGMPDRPLTAFNVAIVRLTEKEDGSCDSQTSSTKVDA